LFEREQNGGMPPSARSERTAKWDFILTSDKRDSSAREEIGSVSKSYKKGKIWPPLFPKFPKKNAHSFKPGRRRSGENPRETKQTEEEEGRGKGALSDRNPKKRKGGGKKGEILAILWHKGPVVGYLTFPTIDEEEKEGGADVEAIKREGKGTGILRNMRSRTGSIPQ